MIDESLKKLDHTGPASEWPATRYAAKILSGDVRSSPHVRAACRRFQKDLQRNDVVYLPDRVQRVFDFFQEGLFMVGGQWEGQAFLLLPWEAFLLANLYGWYYKDSGKRRYIWCYGETAKGSGKTPLCAGLCAYAIGPENEPRAEAYIIGQTFAQAQYALQYAVDMIARSDYAAHYDTRGGEEAASLIGPSGTLKPIAKQAQGAGRSGPQPSFLLCEEYHEHTSSFMLETLSAGFKSRRNPQVIVITNSGENQFSSPCGREHQKAVKIARGDLEHDRYFSFVCALNEDSRAKFFTAEEVWPEANPGLPHLPGYDYIRERIRDAQGDLEKQALVLRRNACVWTDARSEWLPEGAWEAVEHESLTPEIMDMVPDARRVCGLDLSETTDLTAVATVHDLTVTSQWRNAPDDAKPPKLIASVLAWMPSEAVLRLHKLDDVPYPTWVKTGYIRTSGEKVIETEDIALNLIEQMQCSFFGGVAYDKFRIVALKADLQRLGADPVVGNRFADTLKLFGHGQRFQSPPPAREEEGGVSGLSMPQSMTALVESILKKEIYIHFSPVLRFAIGGAQRIRNDAGNWAWDKTKSSSRIDVLVALTMAVGLATQLRRLDDDYGTESEIYSMTEIYERYRLENPIGKKSPQYL